MLRPLPLLLACVALIAGGVATGCGSSSGSSGSGLTAKVPREALAYFEVTLRPSGAARDDALAAAGKLLNSPDPAARIRGLLQQGFARGGDRMVLAFGVDAAAEGIRPDRPLEQGASYAKAAVALGNGFTPSMLFSFPPIVSLVDASGDTSRGWSQARQYLQNLAVLALGTKVDGDTARSRFALAFR